jgi:hypothetical protein
MAKHLQSRKLTKIQHKARPFAVHHELLGHGGFVEGDDNAMAKSLIIVLEGPTLTWYIKLPSLSIDRWAALRGKCLPNIQGYRPQSYHYVGSSTERERASATITTSSYHSNLSYGRWSMELPSTTSSVAFVLSCRPVIHPLHPRSPTNPPSHLRSTHDSRISTIARMRHNTNQGSPSTQETPKHGQENNSLRRPTRKSIKSTTNNNLRTPSQL